jgi:hypothetical protein
MQCVANLTRRQTVPSERLSAQQWVQVQVLAPARMTTGPVALLTEPIRLRWPAMNRPGPLADCGRTRDAHREVGLIDRLLGEPVIAGDLGGRLPRSAV